MSFAAFVASCAGAALSGGVWLRSLLVCELLLTALCLRRLSSRAWPRWLAVAWLAASAGNLIGAVRESWPTLGEDVASALRAASTTGISFDLARAGVEALVERLGTLLGASTGLWLAQTFLVRRRPALAWPAAGIVCVALLGALAWRGATRAGPSPERSIGDDLINLHVDFGKVPLNPVRAVDASKLSAPGPNVIFLMLESVGRDNLVEHIRSHADCRFKQWSERGLYFENVIALASVTHMAQPAILTSHANIDRAQNTMDVRIPRHGTLALPAYLVARGYQAIMVSGQDEDWLNVSRVTMNQPWTFKMHARDFPESARHRNRCGALGAYDSAVVERFILELKEAGRTGRPVFGYASLFNSHYPYVIEHSPEFTRTSSLSCSQYVDMPEEYVEVAHARHEQAILELEQSMFGVVDAFPDALFVIVGDHGEQWRSGPSFAHAKNAMVPQITTSAMVFGPGVPKRRVPEMMSGLDLLPTLIGVLAPKDLDALPAGLFEGVNVLGPSGFARSGPIVTGSHGVLNEFAIIDRGVKYRYSPGRLETCTADDDGAVEPGDPRCEDARAELVFWLACQTDFYAPESVLSARYYNPCFEMLRRASQP